MIDVPGPAKTAGPECIYRDFKSDKVIQKH